MNVTKIEEYRDIILNYNIHEQNTAYFVSSQECENVRFFLE